MCRVRPHGAFQYSIVIRIGTDALQLTRRFNDLEEGEQLIHHTMRRCVRETHLQDQYLKNLVQYRLTSNALHNSDTRQLKTFSGLAAPSNG